jgi:hypothetical protein
MGYLWDTPSGKSGKMANNPGLWQWKKPAGSFSCILCVSWSLDLLTLDIIGEL